MESISFESLLKELGLEDLQLEFNRLFPSYRFSMEGILSRLLEGDLLGAGEQFLQGLMMGMELEFTGIRQMLVMLLTLGILSALLSRLVMVFDRQQTADMAMYIFYVVQAGIIMRCFQRMADVAGETIGNILEFVKFMLPTYLLTMTMSGGSVTEKTYTTVLLGIILLIEYLFVNICLPLCYIYLLLAIVNTIWGEERLALFMELIQKIIRTLLKGSLAVVTAVSVVQNILTPSLDRLSRGTLQKIAGVLPGIGQVTETTLELLLGTMNVLKNGVGILFLVLLLGICIAPILYLYIISFLLEVIAAFTGIVTGKQMTLPIHRTAESIQMLLKTTMTALLLFLLSISMVTLATGGLK
ncbi:MAG: stage III sporulation protein AE [Lachnospiraceae bacterium]|nr:stage III sporulation protein AE [Lachnospiraceae bacterium]